MGESTVVLLFVCAVAAVYVLAACVLARAAARRLGWMARPGRATLFAERGSIALALVGLGCFAYGYFVEPYWPEVTRVRVESPKLRGAARP